MHNRSDRIAVRLQLELTSRSTGIRENDRRANMQVLLLVGRDAWQATFGLPVAISPAFGIQLESSFTS